MLTRHMAHSSRRRSADDGSGIAQRIPSAAEAEAACRNNPVSRPSGDDHGLRRSKHAASGGLTSVYLRP